MIRSGLAGTVDALDVSFNFYAGGLAIVKGGVSRAYANAKGEFVKQETRPITSFWLKASGARPTSPLSVVTRSEEPKGFLLYSPAMDTVGPLFQAVDNKVEVTIGVKLPGEGLERIHAAVASVTEAEQRQVGQCLEELAKEMEASNESRGPKK